MMKNDIQSEIDGRNIGFISTLDYPNEANKRIGNGIAAKNQQQKNHKKIRFKKNLMEFRNNIYFGIGFEHRVY